LLGSFVGVTFTVAAGAAADHTNTAVMSFTGAAKTVNLANTGALGLDTGTVAANSWYSVFLISGTSGVSVMASLETAGAVTVPTMPNGYTLYRRIGSILTNATPNVLGYIQQGDVFFLTTPVLDVNASGTTINGGALLTLSVPRGVSVQPLVRAWTDSLATILLTSPGLETTTVPSATAAPLYDLEAFTSVPQVATPFLLTNISAQIEARSASNADLKIATRGWIDTRGRIS
jgi:hypothetical protein